MTQTLRGKRVLLVEDEYFIAADLKRVLTQAGAEILGPVGEVGPALWLAETGVADVAVLDVNLQGTFTYAVAERLEAAKIPYVFVTGYDGWAIPDAYKAAPRIAKPFPPVVSCVEQLCSERAA